MGIFHVVNYDSSTIVKNLIEKVAVKMNIPEDKIPEYGVTSASASAADTKDPVKWLDEEKKLVEYKNVQMVRKTSCFCSELSLIISLISLRQSIALSQRNQRNDQRKRVQF